MVEQGEEEAAEGDGGDEAEGLMLAGHGAEGGEEGGAVEVADDGEAQQQTGGDSGEGSDALAALTGLALTLDAAQGDVGEVRGQLQRFGRGERLAEDGGFVRYGLVGYGGFTVCFHVSSADKVCGVGGAGGWRWFPYRCRG